MYLSSNDIIPPRKPSRFLIPFSSYIYGNTLASIISPYKLNINAPLSLIIQTFLKTTLTYNKQILPQTLAPPILDFKKKSDTLL